jgi:arylsulfatase
MKKMMNILLIMTDQHRGDCLSIEDHPEHPVMTPNMDSIGGQGVRFSKAYTPCPTCIAARRSILSGQFPSTHGMVGYKEGVEWDAPPTLPQVLKEAGYHTCIVGRDMHQYPQRKRYGYDHMVIGADYAEWVSPKVPDIYISKNGRGAREGILHTSGVMHNDWTARPWHLDETLHLTNWTVNEAIKFLDKRDPTCPFFLTVSFIAPHPPLVPPAFYMERYLRSEIPEPFIGDWEEMPCNRGKGYDVSSRNVMLEGEALKSCKAGYYGSINHVDDQIRRLLNPITGIDYSDTIVIYTSDHGEMLGDHYMWHKIVPYESSARIPLMMRIPESIGIDKGQVISNNACLTDIMPTVLDIVGIDIPDTVEGESLLPLMKGQEISWREYIHIEHSPVHHCLTDGKEKYIWFTQDGREQFFDLENDPRELHDLITDEKLSGRIDDWRHLMIKELKERPEGFTNGKKLVPGCDYPPVMQKIPLKQVRSGF